MPERKRGEIPNLHLGPKDLAQIRQRIEDYFSIEANSNRIMLLASLPKEKI